MRLVIFFLFLIPFYALGQAETFEIFGKITGEHKQRIYLFYEGDVAKSDSISAPIKNGQFHLKLTANLPILCRLHQGGMSEFQDLYIDGRKTYITLSGKLANKENPDSLGGPFAGFTITQVEGSKTENIKRSFAAWKRQLDKSGLSDKQKHRQYYAKMESLVASYPKSKATAYLLAGRLYFLGQAFMYSGGSPLSYSEVRLLSRQLDTALHSTLEWKNLLLLLEKLDQHRNRGAGIPFHDVVLKDTSNQNVNTRQFRNKYVLVDYWASWCMPCRELNPRLRTLYQKYRDKGFEIVSVSIDEDKEAWRKAIRKDGMIWTQLIDEWILAKHYDIVGVPVKTLLDREGKVVGFDLSLEEIENILGKEL